METIPCDADDTSVESFGTGCMRSRPFPEKHRWFMQRTFDILSDRRGNPTAGKLDSKLVTPRGEDLLAAAVSSLVSASETELRRPLRVQFENEPSLDTGGVAREWFGLVAAEFLDERRELFQVVRTTGNNSFSPTDLEAGGSLAYAINPKASLAVHDYLSYYRAFGRFIGKALLEGHLVQLPMTSVIFKHILGEPVSFVDLIELDGGLARSLQLLWDTTTLGSLATVPDRSANVGDDEGQDEEDAYGLDFSVYHTAMGTVDLKPNGRNICVTKQNKREYVTLFTQWHLARSTAEELEAIVLGVHDVVPEELLAPFDFAELRLLLCGLPVLDLDDWKSNTVVAGKLRKSKASRLTRWFWSVLQSMSNEQRERLLQFATVVTTLPMLVSPRPHMFESP
ncbi:hypothetical protein PHYBOEH_006220 [Phytophthora boehmeriae]|uniref:HECT domain-containing protein n=1 Tax=Phytophthora boehmeriae TaxID=109152 RepID=A0A8T1WI99_9STRA|nr:hypothetical protein PHYBOEH_006220 [Phytophthora boehmeriae]